MSKSKWFMVSVLVMAVTVAVGLGVAGCAKNSTAGPDSSAPPVTTDGTAENGQSSGSSDQQQTQTGGQQSTQTNEQGSPAAGQTALKEALSGLVSKGTITQDQADKVAQAFASSRPEPGQGQGQKAGSGQSAEPGQRKGPLDELVTNGTLTQSQADAIMQALPRSQGGPGNPGTGQTSTQ